MTHLTYRIVEHDGGWAYKVGDTFSETFPNHDGARSAALAASREQRVADAPSTIEYADADGAWIVEQVDGADRPDTDVEG